MACSVGGSGGAGRPEESRERIYLNSLKGRTVTLEAVVSADVSGGAGASPAERIQDFAARLLSHESAILPDDIYALSKIHDHPSLSIDLKNRLFVSILRLGLSDIVDPHARETKLIELVSKIPDLVTEERVLGFISRFPLSELTAENIEAVVLLSPGLTVPKGEIQSFFKKVKHESIANIHAALPLLAGISYGWERLDILIAIRELPATERDAVIRAVLPLLVGITEGSEKLDMLIAVKALPAAERDAAIAVALPLLAVIPSVRDRAVILMAVGKMPATERKSICEAYLPNLTSRHRSRTIDNLIALGESLEAVRGSDITTAAQPLLVGVFGAWERVDILQAVGKLPAAERSAIITLIQPLLVDIFDILKAIRKLPAAERNAVIAATKSLLSGASDRRRRIAILIVVGELPIAERDATITAALPLLAGIPDVPKRGAVLSAVGELPAAERAAAITTTRSLLVGIAAVLRAVGELPADERGDIITAARPLLEGVSDSETVAILRAVEKLPVAEREATITAARTLLMGIFDGVARVQILETVGRLSVDARALLTERISSLIVGSTSANQRSFIISLLGMMPPSQWTDENIHSIITLSNIIENYPTIVGVLRMIAPDCIPSVVTILLNASEAHDLPRDGILTYIFNADASLSARSHAYLLEKLSTITDRREAYGLAAYIINNSFQMRLSEISALFQQALHVLLITDPDASRNPKNPYRIFSIIKDLESTESVLEAPLQTLGDQTVRLDVAAVRAESEKVSAAATFATLPHEVAPHTLRDLFTAMRARIAALPEGEQAAVRAVIASMYPGSADADILTVLERNLIADPYLTRLLNITGAPTDRVPRDVWEFYNIIQFIQQQSGEVAAGEKLSPLEEILIKMSLSIQFCPGGKKEGIGLAYGQIRGIGRTAGSLDEDALRAVLYEEVVMPYLQHLLSGDGPFLREMTGVPAGSPIGQLAHQAIYIKNLLAKRIGLPWNATFDHLTGVLYDALIGKTVSQALETFLRHFSAEKLRDIVQAEVKKRFKDLESPETREKAKPFHDAIMTCINHNPTYLSYDEDDDFHITDFELTPEGTTKLLLNLGFLEAPA